VDGVEEEMGAWRVFRVGSGRRGRERRGLRKSEIRSFSPFPPRELLLYATPWNFPLPS